MFPNHMFLQTMLKCFILDMVNLLLIPRNFKNTVPRTTNCPMKEERVVFGGAHITTEHANLRKSMITFDLHDYITFDYI